MLILVTHDIAMYTTRVSLLIPRWTVMRSLTTNTASLSFQNIPGHDRSTSGGSKPPTQNSSQPSPSSSAASAGSGPKLTGSADKGFFE